MVPFRYFIEQSFENRYWLHYLAFYHYRYRIHYYVFTHLVILPYIFIRRPLIYHSILEEFSVMVPWEAIYIAIRNFEVWLYILTDRW